MSRPPSFLCLLIVLIACRVSGAFGGTILYVDADAVGADNGSNWDNAFNDLQDALAVTASGDEIRVASGTYTPDRGTGDRTASFDLVDGVDLRGGYAGFGASD